MKSSTEKIPQLEILGSRVHMVEVDDAVVIIASLIETERTRTHYVVNTGMHGLMEGRRDPKFRIILNDADLFCPDGILTLLVARARGYSIRKRRTGPELLWEFCQATQQKRYKHYFYGDTEDTLHLMSAKLSQSFPDMNIVGLHSPPFRQLTPAEDESVLAAINAAQPDVLWVGLGAPKQERWIFEHRDRLKIPMIVGAGASFKFVAGTVKRAPAWLQYIGLEWLFRLLMEPRRVWRRVFLDAPQFIGLAMLEISGLKKYK